MAPELHELIGCLAVAQQVIFFALMIVCAYTDIAKDKVYNWATLPALFAGLALWFIPFQLGRPFLLAAGAAALGGGIFFLFFLFKAVGGGDVKLMAAIGALMGLDFTLNALIIIAILGAIMALGVLLFRRRLRHGLKSSLKMLFTFKRKKAAHEKPLTIPYGVAITIGSIFTWALLMFSGHLTSIATMARTAPR